MNEYFDSPQTDSQEEKKRHLLETAAKLIKSCIKGKPESKELYPGLEDLKAIDKNLSYSPDSLQLILKSIFVGDDDLKVAAIGQAIIQAARPKSILAPLQVGFAVQMHHKFGSRFLNETISKLGFGVSYKEMKKI